MWFYFWEKYGLEKTTLILKKDYLKDKGHVKKGEPNFINVIAGKLQYLKMIKGAQDATYLKLNSRFEKLIKSDAKGSIKLIGNPKQNHNMNIVDLILTEGLEKAMNGYK